MTREIKFRAWFDNKMWGIGYIDFANHRMQIAHLHKNICYGASMEYFKDAELMQFTGLKDKNGVEIYEGDIIDYKGEPVVVEYVNDMFHCKSTKYPNLTDGCYRLDYIRTAHHIIGNIYENPELLDVR